MILTIKIALWISWIVLLIEGWNHAGGPGNKRAIQKLVVLASIKMSSAQKEALIQSRKGDQMTTGKFTSLDPMFSYAGIAKLQTPDVHMSEEMMV